jgi:hypothetical protein
MGVAATWGSTPEERAGAWPCDALGPAGAYALFRGVTVGAPRDLVFRWLCQLRVAPYSYDWIDNRGRRSPRTLTPGLERLARGQSVMTIFELVDFAPGEHLTLANRARGGGRPVFGGIWCTYRTRDAAASGTRLAVKLLVQPPRGPAGRLSAALLPWGDLVMMRKQLLTLKALAERDAAASRRG